MHLPIIRLIAFTAIGLLFVDSVRFPNQRRNFCPSADDKCVEITSCPSALTGFKAGKQPKVCGWIKEVPLVCCPQDTTKEKEPRNIEGKLIKISSISPKGCGTRKIDTIPVVPETSYDFTVDAPISLDPRITEDEVNTYLPPVGSGPIEIFPVMFAAAIFNGNKQKQLCGGAVVDDRHVITASHCFAGKRNVLRRASLESPKKNFLEMHLLAPIPYVACPCVLVWTRAGLCCVGIEYNICRFSFYLWKL
ncbi:clotting factor B [Caerostris extrusa]|uniref:Clotting factor B n=1 Tax=Caerostris extrusa TaxID=172846 RepID=A0AAV4VN72_CAEEX|nr:clotting factor B [Caerostris extrusa]